MKRKLPEPCAQVLTRLSFRLISPLAGKWLIRCQGLSPAMASPGGAEFHQITDESAPRCVGGSQQRVSAAMVNICTRVTAPLL